MLRKSSSLYVYQLFQPLVIHYLRRKLPGHLASKLRWIDSFILTLNLLQLRQIHLQNTMELILSLFKIYLLYLYYDNDNNNAC